MSLSGQYPPMSVIQEKVPCNLIPSLPHCFRPYLLTLSPDSLLAVSAYSWHMSASEAHLDSFFCLESRIYIPPSVVKSELTPPFNITNSIPPVNPGLPIQFTLLYVFSVACMTIYYTTSFTNLSYLLSGFSHWCGSTVVWNRVFIFYYIC